MFLASRRLGGHTRARDSGAGDEGDGLSQAGGAAACLHQEKTGVSNLTPVKVRKAKPFGYFPNKSATMAFSSFNSASVAAILALLKSFNGTPWTISHFWPSLRIG